MALDRKNIPGPEVYIAQCNAYLSELHPTNRWTPQGAKLQLENLVATLGQDIALEITQSRWNAKSGIPYLSEVARLEDLIFRPSVIEGLSVGINTVPWMVHRYPDSTYLCIGSGFAPLKGVEPFGKNVVLVDPKYQNTDNAQASDRGYQQIPQPYSPELLDSLGKQLVVALSSSVHHLENPQQALGEIFSHPAVVGVIVSDYLFPSFKRDLPFVLKELPSLFPTAPERLEICELGIQEFIGLHTQPIYEHTIKAARSNGFKRTELKTFPRATAADNLDGLSAAEVEVYQSGLRFGASFIRTP